MSGLFSCPNQKASFQLEVNHFAAMIMVATSIPKEIINDNTLNVLILITANPRVDQQRLDPFRGLKFNIVLSIIKVNRLEVPNSHLGDQQEPLLLLFYYYMSMLQYTKYSQCLLRRNYVQEIFVIGHFNYCPVFEWVW